MPKAPQRLALTEKLVAAVERMEPDSGPELAYALMSDDDFAAAARNFLDQLDGGPIRVFAYGSLIWKQAFEHEHAERGRTHGWRRSFCLDIARWRATPQEPGLMMALDRGGSCDGVVFRLPDSDHQTQMERLLRRECAYREDLQSFRWLKVRTVSGMFPAFTFYAAPMSPGYHIDLPIEHYHIPMLLYGPGLVAPQHVDTLASQMDFAPTLAGLLGLHYTSKFFGRDILRMRSDEGRALPASYERLGYWRGSELVVLSPRRDVSFERIGADGWTNFPAPPPPDAERLLREATAYYESASILYGSRR